MLRRVAACAAFVAVVLLAVAYGLARAGAAERSRIRTASSIDLQECFSLRAGGTALCGTYEVFENRDAAAGRTISLNIVVVPARDPASETTPVFYLAGGPGGAATDALGGMARSWMRERHDIVLVDQRGTGKSHPLGCGWSGTDGLQGYLESSFGSPEHFERCRTVLERSADLRMYTTPIAVDDLNEVREALGYEQINLYGGSYGSRAALVYMRRHPETVRGAILSGIAPISFTNPLYHAREAQNALDEIFAECASDEACNTAFPSLSRKFQELMSRLDEEPAMVTVRHPRTGALENVALGREAFADGLRIFMYYMPRARSVPAIVHAAWAGDLDFVAQEILNSNVGLASGLQMGLLLSVTCVEDVARIDARDIPAATEGTFLGDARVRRQMAACEVWPLGDVPEAYGDPVSVDVPVLLFSGTMDPVTGPRWGEDAASHLPDSLHLVVPGAHGVAGRCTNDIGRQFLESGSLQGLDISCIQNLRLPPFDLR